LTKLGNGDILILMVKYFMRIPGGLFRPLIFLYNTLTIIFLIFLPFNSLQAKTVVREGESFVTFHKLYIPEIIAQGELYQFSVHLGTKKNIWENMSVFYHVTDPKDGKILINNDFSPAIPPIQWTVGEIVNLGPVNGYIPPDFPPGTYDIRMGLFTTKITPEEVLYIAEPYTNSEIKDFVIGKIKVEKASPEIAKKKEDLIISNFETLADLKKWQTRGTLIEQSEENVAEGKYSGKITYLKGQGIPAAILESFFNYSEPKYSDWSEYDILEFQIYSTKDKEGLIYPVNIQIKDKSERRYQSSIPRTQQTGEPVKFILSNVDKVVDLTDIGNLSFWVGGTPPDQDWVIYLDDIKLVSLGLEKQKSPFVRFEGIKISKDKVKAGEEIEIQPSFSTSQRFSDDYGLFIHIYRSVDKAGWINADMSLSPPTTSWEVNKVIAQGPFAIFIPPDNPPGKYSIETGLFLAKQVPEGADYIKYHRGKNGVYYIQQPQYPLDYFKQPYVNYEEYGDWVVGSFEVVAPEARSNSD